MQRRDDFKFQVTENIPAQQLSTPENLSLREAFLFFAWRITMDNGYDQRPIGEKLGCIANTFSKD